MDRPDRAHGAYTCPLGSLWPACPLNAAEPLPPWAMHPGARYEAFWIECCDPHVHSMCLPFWNALDDERRAAHLARFPLPPGWQAFLDDVSLDREWARIDAEDIASGVLKPNGMPWPPLESARLSRSLRIREWLRALGRRLPSRP